MAPIDIVIGERGGDHVRIRIVSRTEQVIRDVWDANWLVAVVSVHAGGWRGRNAEAFFRTEELARLRAKVELMAEGRLSDAEFAPMEPHIRLRLAHEEGGPVSVTGTATDRLEGGNTLSFALRMDPAGLADLAARLGRVEKAWPTVGKP